MVGWLLPPWTWGPKVMSAGMLCRLVAVTCHPDVLLLCLLFASLVSVSFRVGFLLPAGSVWLWCPPVCPLLSMYLWGDCRAGGTTGSTPRSQAVHEHVSSAGYWPRWTLGRVFQCSPHLGVTTEGCPARASLALWNPVAGLQFRRQPGELFLSKARAVPCFLPLIFVLSRPVL